MRKIVVTGAAGFVGRKLVDRLARDDENEILVISRDAGLFSKFDNVTPLTGSLEGLDSSTFKGIEEVNDVYHLGAYTPKSSSGNCDIEAVFNSNVVGTKRLLESLPDVVGKFVFSSTLDVYGSLEEGQLLDENTSVSPRSFYSASKFFCEGLVACFCEKNGVDFSILRYGHIFGPGEEKYKKLIPLTMSRILDGLRPEIYGDGKLLRDFLYVDDAVEATLRAASSKEECGSPINIVSGDSRTVAAVVRDIIDVSGANVEPIYKESDAGSSIIFCPKKMKKVLGCWQLVGFKQGLSAEFKHMKGLMHE
jgi:UDP-glucose 4-epimerase